MFCVSAESERVKSTRRSSSPVRTSTLFNVVGCDEKLVTYSSYTSNAPFSSCASVGGFGTRSSTGGGSTTCDDAARLAQNRNTPAPASVQRHAFIGIAISLPWQSSGC